MRRFGLLLAAILASHATAQPGPQAVAWSGGGPAADTGADVATNWQGAVALVGTFKGTATFGSVSITDLATGCVFSSCHDGYVAVYNPDGTVRWARRMGTPVHNDFAEGVAIAADGTVYVSGYFTGVATWDGGANPDVELTTRSNWDAFLAKYSQDGDLQWVIQAGGTDQDTGRGIDIDDDGNVYWTGSFYGTATFGEGANAVTFSSEGSSDGFVARVNADGSLAWAVQLGGQEGADLYDAAVSTPLSPRVYVTGTFAGVGTLGGEALQSRGLDDIIVAALDINDGTALWAEQIGGSGRDHGRGIDAGRIWIDDVYVAGWFENQILVGPDVLTSAGLSDALVVGLDTYGQILWGERAGGAGFDIAEDVAAAEGLRLATRGLPGSDAVLLTGYVDGAATFSSSTGNVPVAAQARDGFFAAYGAYDWDHGLLLLRLLGGANNDAGHGVGATMSFDYLPPFPMEARSMYALVGGTFSGTGSIFDQSVSSAGSADAFVGKLGTCPEFLCWGVSAETTPDAGRLGLSVSPNPASAGSRVHIKIDTPRNVSVDLIDALGRVVAQLAAGPHAAGEHELRLPLLPPGVYHVRARSPDGVAGRSFVVAR